MVSAGRSPEPIMVGPYRLIQRLGEGGMGVVHLALDADGRAVAIKVLRPHIATDPDARLRLEREVATLRRVKHPRVAAVIDADVDGELPYLVTTFVPGKPLDTYIKEHGPLPRGHVARVGSVLADALKAIHAAGVVHRDVKPANVMMLDGEPILIDFGIAHLADESRITHTGLVMGTPGYLSPEIIGGEPVSTATDWWGWGATLAYAATGRAPFGTGPIEVVLDRVRRGVSDLAGMDEGLRHTLTQALSVDPGRRPAPEVLVAGLAAVPPVRSRPNAVIDAVIDLDDVAGGPSGGSSGGGSLGGGQAVGPGPYPVRPDDRTVPRPPPGSSDNVTMRMPPPDEAGMQPGMRPGMRPGSEDPTDPVPPPASWQAAQEWGRQPVYAGRPSAQPAGPSSGSSSVPSSGSSSGQGAATEVIGAIPDVVNRTAAYPDTHQPAQQPTQQPAQQREAGPANQTPEWSQTAQSPRTTRSPRSPEQERYPDGDETRGGASALREPIDPAQAGRGLLIGVLVVFSLVAGVAPQSAITITWVLIAVMRVVDDSNTTLLLRRQHHGQRGSDRVVIAFSVPWRLLVGLVSSLVLLILPILIGVSVTFIAAAVLAGNPDQAIPSGPGSLAAGMAALLLTVWRGPGSGAVRRGTRLVVRKMVTTRRSQLVVWGVVVIFVIAALTVISHQDSPDWGTWRGTWIVRQLSR